MMQQFNTNGNRLQSCDQITSLYIVEKGQGGPYDPRITHRTQYCINNLITRC